MCLAGRPRPSARRDGSTLDHFYVRRRVASALTIVRRGVQPMAPASTGCMLCQLLGYGEDQQTVRMGKRFRLEILQTFGIDVRMCGS